MTTAAVWSKNPRFKTGARRTPPHKVAEAIASGRLKVHRAFAPPASSAMVPKQRSMFGNSDYGDCVTAEECFAASAVSAMVGQEWLAADQTWLDFCNKFGVLNGADLLSVIQDMESDGFHQGSDTVTDGNYALVDYTNADAFKSAISQSPVKVSIAANDLPSGTGSQDGWVAFGAGSGWPQDHCTSYCGAGTALQCFQALGLPVPSGVDPNKPDCFLHYTWSTIGVVDWAWTQSTVTEAYVRNSIMLNGKPWTITPGPGPQPGTFTPPYFLWSGGVQIPLLSFPDQASAISMATILAQVQKSEVDVKDSNGLLVQAVQPPGPGPGPGPGPTPGGIITVSQAIPAGSYAPVSAATLASLGTLGKNIDQIVAAAIAFENAIKAAKGK